jgi:hypothetical protein
MDERYVCSRLLLRKGCGEAMLRFFLATAIAAVSLTTSALAIGLTEDDFEYLSTHGIERASPLIQALSPKENARLHAIINDVRTKDDPSARIMALETALNEFREHQRWEIMNPGRLWDEPKRELFKR